MIEQFLNEIITAFKLSIGIWLPIWGLRYRYELDKKLDILARQIRWSIVLVSYAIASLPVA